MSEQIENPVKAFGLHVAHVGINARQPRGGPAGRRLFQASWGLSPTSRPSRSSQARS